MEELRAAQAVLLPAVMNTTLTETAALLGVGRATVARLQSKFRQSAEHILGADRAAKFRKATRCTADLGGRRRVSGSVARTGQRRSTTRRFPAASGFGGKIGQDRESLRWCIGLLARHGWRKVAPDARRCPGRRSQKRIPGD